MKANTPRFGGVYDNGVPVSLIFIKSGQRSTHEHDRSSNMFGAYEQSNHHVRESAGGQAPEHGREKGKETKRMKYYPCIGLIVEAGEGR